MPQSASEPFLTSFKGLVAEVGGEAPFTSSLKEISLHLEALGMDRQAFVLSECSQDNLYFACGCEFKKFKKRCNYYKVCPICSKIRKDKVQSQFYKKLKKAKPHIPRYRNHRGLRLLTLTYKNYPTLIDLFENLPNLKSSIIRFLRLDYIKQRIFAGIGVYEIERNQKGFFLHCHMLIDSRYLDNISHKKKLSEGEIVAHSKLSEAWLKATKQEAYVVDVRGIYSIKGGLNYVIKYITKPHNFTPKESAQYFQLSYKKRSFFTFGNFYNKYNSKPSKYACDLCGCPLDCVAFSDTGFLEWKKRNLSLDKYKWLDSLPPPEVPKKKNKLVNIKGTTISYKAMVSCKKLTSYPDFC